MKTTSITLFLLITAIGCAQPGDPQIALVPGGASASFGVTAHEPTVVSDDDEPRLGTPIVLDPASCALEDQAARLAGEGARDCGFVPIGEPGEAARACAAEAFALGDAFHVAYALQGYDSEIVEMVSGDANGRVLVTLYDSSPCGGGDCAPTYHTTLCLAPDLAEDGSIRCTETLPFLQLLCG